MAEKEIPIRDLLNICLSSDKEEHWREFVHRTQPLIASVIIHTMRRWKEPAPSLVDDLIQMTTLEAGICGLWANSSMETAKNIAAGAARLNAAWAYLQLNIKF